MSGHLPSQPQGRGLHQITGVAVAHLLLRRAVCLAAILCLAIAAGAPTGLSASAWAEMPRLCDAAAARASAATGVPLSVLKAIALTETGRTREGSFRPWPWTVNMEGKGVWFDTYEEAREYVRRHHDRGARSYDVGCFQINYRWHGKAFRSVEEMFDPVANATYAAKFLRDLHAELGDWSRAAGAYHSRTPSYANRYRARFERIRARLVQRGVDSRETLVAAIQDLPPPTAPIPGAAQDGPAAPAPPRDNRFPLLLETGADRGLGSLVPLEIAAGRRLIDAGSGG